MYSPAALAGQTKNVQRPQSFRGTLQRAGTCSPLKFPFPWGSGLPHRIHCSLCPHESAKWHHGLFNRFCTTDGRAQHADKHTDHIARDSCSDCPHLSSACSRCHLKLKICQHLATFRATANCHTAHGTFLCPVYAGDIKR